MEKKEDEAPPIAAIDTLNDEFMNLEEIYKKNGSALAMKFDAKLKDDEVVKLIRKE
jgi:hypothetical protein